MTDQPPAPDAIPIPRPDPPIQSTPPAGYLPPPPPPANNTNRTAVFVGLGILLAVLVGVGAFSGLTRAGNEAAERREYAVKAAEAEAPLRVGDCVRPVPGPKPYLRSSCDRPEVTAKIIAAFGSTGDGQGCPAETDLVLRKDGAVLCGLNTTTDHPGLPGKGGGIMTGGDCVTVIGAGGSSASYRESACDSPRVYEKLTARVATPAACVAPAVRYFQLHTTVLPIACLADGPGIAGVGECLGDVETVKTFDAVPCSAPAAGGKVLARRPTKEACENVPGMSFWIEDGAGLPATRYLCLEELRD